MDPGCSEAAFPDRRGAPIYTNSRSTAQAAAYYCKNNTIKNMKNFKVVKNEVLGRIRRSGGYGSFRLGPEINLAGSAKFPASDFPKLGFNPPTIVIIILSLLSLLFVSLLLSLEPPNHPTTVPAAPVLAAAGPDAGEAAATHPPDRPAVCDAVRAAAGPSRGGAFDTGLNLM